MCSVNNGIGLTNSYSDIEELDIRIRWNNSLQEVAINDPNALFSKTKDLWADGICASGGKNCNVTDDTLQSDFNVINDYAINNRCVFIAPSAPGKRSAECSGISVWSDTSCLRGAVCRTFPIQ
ncbi:hypothetical protein GCK72_012281 [Caenorhabditis remanei]|uniref:Uncharacterized protein n=1 Tax=Caenorhabditis remanei TaxID=31234 RepID=A0A6A5GMF4_CAERE|nr:hypothetical protein GCK72_012281 [Caenorhabditis remanei]KAF1755831.1 hypothetical protein GCK72_012281 [Caenorhabditis remanei]